MESDAVPILMPAVVADPAFWKRAVSFVAQALGAVEGFQLAAVYQAVEAPVLAHVLTVCAFACGAASNASAAMSNRSIRKSGVLVFMGWARQELAGVSWQGLAVRGRNSKVGERGWPRLAGGLPLFPQAFGSERQQLVCRVDRTGGRGEKVFRGQAPRGLVNKRASFVSRLFMACFRGCRAHCKWQGKCVATRNARHEPENRAPRCEDFVTCLFLDLQRLEL